jgi:hypothetical protein
MRGSCWIIKYLRTGVRPEKFLLETRLFLFVMDAYAVLLVPFKMHLFPAVAIPYVQASYQVYTIITLLSLLVTAIPLLCHDQGRQFSNLDTQFLYLILQISIIHDDRCIKILFAPDLVTLWAWTMCSILVWKIIKLL